MTQWNGIKVGALYTDQLDKDHGEPAVMMCISMRQGGGERWGAPDAVVTFLWRGQVVEHTVPSDWMGWNDGELRGPEHWVDIPNGPYTELAAPA